MHFIKTVSCFFVGHDFGRWVKRPSLGVRYRYCKHCQARQQENLG